MLLKNKFDLIWSVSARYIELQWPITTNYLPFVRHRCVAGIEPRRNSTIHALRVIVGYDVRISPRPVNCRDCGEIHAFHTDCRSWV